MMVLVPRRWSGALAAFSFVVALAAHAETPLVIEEPAGPAACVDAALRDMTVALATPAGAQPTRAERLRAVMERYVDIAQLGRNTVGVAWTVVPAAQQAEFLTTFQSFLTMRVTGSINKPDDLEFGPARVLAPKAGAAADPSAPSVVVVDLRSADGLQRPILFAVARTDDGRYRIVDVSAEGISLGRLLAADFGGFLRRNGGRLEALMVVLQDKVAKSLAAR